MLMRVLKTTFLFAAYTTLGVTGDYVAGLMAREPESGPRVVVRADPQVSVSSAARVLVGHSAACAYQVERRVSVPADATLTLRLTAGSGELHVQGREGLTEVRAVGTACASDRDDLDRLQLSAQRTEGAVVLETRYPHGIRLGGDHVARIDLTVEVPMGMAADIEDSSGSMDVAGTGSLKIQDGSGSMSVHDIRGPVSIEDGSGGIEVAQVTGSLDVQDGSGGISVRDVTGRVRLGDGSGGIDVKGAGSDVVVENDGSGSISVSDVRGDFSVLHDGSGSVHYTRVGGAVNVPRDKHHGRR